MSFFRNVSMISLLAVASSAFGANVTCNDLAITYDELPFDVQTELEIAAGTTITIPALNDPIVEVRIRPATTLDRADAFLCNVDYGADLTAGTAALWFDREGPYYAQVTRQSGLIQDGSICVGCAFRDGGGAGGKPDYNEIETPPNDVAIIDDGHSDDMADAWGDNGECAASAGEAVSDVCAASEAAGGKVDVVIDAHGDSSGFDLGSDSVDEDNVCALFSAMKPKVSSVTLFSCNVGDNLELLCNLAECLCVKVTSYTGKVSNVGTQLYIEDGGGIVTKEVPTHVRAINMELHLDGDGFVPPPGAPATTLSLPLDAFGDSWFSGVLGLLAVWGDESASQASGWDLDRDGTVNGNDLELLMALTS